jgi:hypothetical protein
MQQMTGAWTSGQNLLCAQFALPLFTLLSHHKHPPQKVHNPQQTKPNHPRQHLPPKSFLRRVDHATRMRGGGAKVKSPVSLHYIQGLRFARNRSEKIA